MESKEGAARVYQDFEPSMEWVPEDDSDTLLVYLPGFAKEQLRVQLRSRNLIISGERKVQHNSWTRFRVEFPVSVNCDLNKISAKFEGYILFVRQPKLITAAPKPKEEVKPQTPADQPNVAPETSTTKLKENKDEVVEEKASDPKSTQGVSENALEKEKSDRDDKNHKIKNPVAYGELDKMTKTALDKYKRAAGVFAMKLKTSCDTVNTIVILFVGLAIGILVSNSIKSWNKA